MVGTTSEVVGTEVVLSGLVVRRVWVDREDILRREVAMVVLGTAVVVVVGTMVVGMLRKDEVVGGRIIRERLVAVGGSSEQA